MPEAEIDLQVAGIRARDDRAISLWHAAEEKLVALLKQWRVWRSRMVTDQLTLARAFSSTGMEQENADKIATAVFDAIHDNVATKADLLDAKRELKSDLRELKHELTLRGIAALFAAFGLLFAALHAWPPHP